MTAASVYSRAYAAGYKPDPLLLVSEWADRNRELSSIVTDEPGRWRTARTPYLREIMDCLSPASPIETIVFMKGAQVGATECGNNWIGYVIDQAPGPMMAVLPTVETAKRWSKQRLAHVIDDTPCLRGKVADPRERDSGNTMLAKEFAGGILIITGANSGVGLRSMPARFMFFDEIDGYPADVDGEGDPVALAEKRSANFRRRKLFKVSTPTIEGISRIDREFARSDQRYYFVPCPHCGAYQTLKFARLKWPKGEPGKALYLCESCEQPIGEQHKTAMLEAGQWRGTAGHNGRVAGFHLSSLYSPVGWFSWAQAAAAWEKAQEDPSSLQVFVNTVLGETWRQQGEAPDWEKLYSRRETWERDKLPGGVLFVTAGVDVQKDRLEAAVYGWGRQRERWLIDYEVLPGYPDRPETWAALDELVNRTYPHASGADLSIVRMGLDSSYATNDVYAWGRKHGMGRVLILDPRERGVSMVGLPTAVDVSVQGRKIRRGVKIWPVATGMLKSELYGLLRVERPEAGSIPPGYCHFPDWLPEEFFKQLCAEQLVSQRDKRGYKRTQWVKMRERNEGLDTAIYARAAANVFGLDRFGDAQWRALEAAHKPKAEESKEIEPPPEEPALRRIIPPQSRNWLDRRDGWLRR